MLLLKSCLFQQHLFEKYTNNTQNRLNILIGEPPSPRPSPDVFLLQVSQTPSRSFQAFNLKCENRPRSIRAVRGQTPIYPACRGWSSVFIIFLNEQSRFQLREQHLLMFPPLWGWILSLGRTPAEVVGCLGFVSYVQTLKPHSELNRSPIPIHTHKHRAAWWPVSPFQQLLFFSLKNMNSLFL